MASVSPTTRAVFFDRDGVLNEALVKEGRPLPPARLEDLRIIAGAEEGLAALAAAGFILVGVTNQPDVARGTQSREAVEAMNRALLSALPLQEILVCYHDDADNCGCRKPRPGLILAASTKYRIDLSQSFLVGDRWRDVEAGRRAGCRTILVDYRYAETYRGQAPDIRTSSLAEAVRVILGRVAEGEGMHA